MWFYSRNIFVFYYIFAGCTEIQSGSCGHHNRPIAYHEYWQRERENQERVGTEGRASKPSNCEVTQERLEQSSIKKQRSKMAASTVGTIAGHLSKAPPANIWWWHRLGVFAREYYARGREDRYVFTEWGVHGGASLEWRFPVYIRTW